MVGGDSFCGSNATSPAMFPSPTNFTGSGFELVQETNWISRHDPGIIASTDYGRMSRFKSATPNSATTTCRE